MRKRYVKLNDKLVINQGGFWKISGKSFTRNPLNLEDIHKYLIEKKRFILFDNGTLFDGLHHRQMTPDDYILDIFPRFEKLSIQHTSRSWDDLLQWLRESNVTGYVTSIDNAISQGQEPYIVILRCGKTCQILNKIFHGKIRMNCGTNEGKESQYHREVIEMATALSNNELNNIIRMWKCDVMLYIKCDDDIPDETIKDIARSYHSVIVNKTLKINMTVNQIANTIINKIVELRS